MSRDPARREALSKVPRLIAARDNFGSVAVCPRGCVHVSIGHVGVRLTEKEYWTLMELLSEAARQLAGTGNRKPAGIFQRQPDHDCRLP